MRSGSVGWRIGRALFVVVATTAALLVVRRVSRRPGGALELVVGSLVLPVGVGIAGQWLSESPSVTAVAGVVVGVSGAALVVAGALDLFHGVPAGWWALIVPLLVVLLALVLRIVAVPVAATNVPPGSAPPRTTVIAGVAAEPVTITSEGARLAAWWVPPRDGAAVVVVPGAGSTRATVRDQAAVLVRAGYGVLLLDPRGHGASTGTPMDFGWYGETDLSAAVDHLSHLEGVDARRIGVLGMSMGGEQAIGASGLDGRIRAVVAEGATGRTAADNSWLSEEYGFAGVLQEQIDRISFAITDLLTGASPPRTLEESVRRSDAPTLLIAAGGVVDEGLVAERLRGADPGDVDVWVVEGAAHVGGLAAEPREWERRVVAHFAGALTPS